MANKNAGGQEPTIENILAACRQAVETGNRIDRKALRERYPQFAAELDQFFHDLDVDKEDSLSRAPQQNKTPVARGSASARFSDETQDDRASQLRKSADTSHLGTAVSKVRCPTCQNPIKLDQVSEHVLCPGCGNTFRLCNADVTATNSGMKSMGKFQLIERVGVGGFGAVWKARDTELDRTIALKIPHSGLLTENQELERFQREARAAAQLRHPNIVNVYEVATLNGLPVIVCEFVPGVPLKDLLEVRRLTFRQSAALLVEIASALDYAHSLGVVHRDVKPANIMLLRGAANPVSDSATMLADELSEIGKPMLLDFGLALRDANETTMTIDGNVLGTPAFMSPEQADGRSHQADRRSDVYSLGVVLYQLLTGELPFRGSRLMMLEQVMYEEPRRPRLINDRTPRDLETICLKCLRKNPEKRYATAKELANDLGRYLRGEPILARPVGWLERGWLWCRRSPARAAAGLLASLLLATLVVTAVVVAIREKNNADRLDGLRKVAEKSLLDSQRQEAKSILEKALLTCEQGEIQRGLLLLSKGLDKAILAKADELEQAYRWNIGAWSEEIHRLTQLLPHPEPVLAVAFSPNGKLLATGCKDGNLRLWNVSDGSPAGEPLAHGAPVSCLAFHPKGDLLAAGCGNGNAHLWHLPTRQPAVPPMQHMAADTTKIPWHGKSGVQCVAISPDGLSLLTGAIDGTVRLWSTESGESKEAIFRPGVDAVFAVAFRPDGAAFLTAGPAGMREWNSRTRVPLGPNSLPSSKYVLSATYSPDGKKVVAAIIQERAAVQVNPATGAAQGAKLQHQEFVWSACYSPDGRLVLSAGRDQKARLWDAATSQPFGPPLEHSGAIFGVAFSPDNQTFATVSEDRSAKLWRIASHGPLIKLPHSNYVRSVAFSGDGKRLATGSFVGSRVWDWATANSTKIYGLDHETQGVAISPDGKTLYASYRHRPTHLSRWDIDSGNLLSQARGGANDAERLTLSADGLTIVTGGDKGAAQIWNAETGQPRGQLLQHDPGSEIIAMAVSPDGETVLTGSSDKTTRLWDAESGRPIGTPRRHDSGISSVAFSADGQDILTGSTGGFLQRWTADAWTPIGPPMQQNGDILGLGFVKDKHLIASACADGNARYWFAPTGHAVGPPLRHGVAVHAVAVHPERALIATACDYWAMLWTVPAPVTEPVEEVFGWVNAMTGLDMDADGTIRALPVPEWQERSDKFGRIHARPKRHAPVQPVTPATPIPPPKSETKPNAVPAVVWAPQNKRLAASAQEIAGLIRQLQSDKPATRAEAEKSLLAVGTAALPALIDAARTSTADDTKRLTAVRDKIDVATALTPTRIHLKASDAPIGDVVLALAKQGIPLAYPNPSAAKDSPAKITLELDGVSCAEAVDRLCQAANLRCQSIFGNGGRTIHLMDVKKTPGGSTACAGPLYLQAQSVGHNRSVSVDGSYPYERLSLFVGVTMCDESSTFTSIKNPRVTEISDAAGQSLGLPPLPIPEFGDIRYADFRFTTQMPIDLPVPPKSTGRIHIKGIILCNALVRRQALVSAADWSKAQSFDGVGGMRLTIHDVKAIPGIKTPPGVKGPPGQTVLSISITEPGQWKYAPFVQRFELVDADNRRHPVEFLNVANVKRKELRPDDLTWLSGEPSLGFPSAIPWPSLARMGPSSHWQVSGQLTVPTVPMAPPVRLEFCSFETRSTEFPFEFHNVPLP
jgi:WD40 repeat protein/tRNA A-37 threonylcarbamoyl transferase component Bud32